MRFGWLLLTSLVLTFSTRGYAQREENPAGATTEPTDEEVARRAFWKGKAHYDAGEIPEAIEQFERAYALTQDPDLVYNIAQSHRKAGECRLALSHYRTFLRLAPESPLANQAQKQITALQDTCESHESSAAQESGSSHARIERPSKPLPATARAQQPSLDPTAPQPFDLSGSRLRSPVAERWALIALCGAVAAAGVGVGLELWNEDRYHQWEARDQDLKKGKAQGEADTAWAVRQARNDELARSIARVNREVIYLTVGTGMLLTTSAVLYFWKPTKPTPVKLGGKIRDSAKPLGSIALGVQRGGLAIIGSF